MALAACSGCWWPPHEHVHELELPIPGVGFFAGSGGAGAVKVICGSAAEPVGGTDCVAVEEPTEVGVPARCE